jgi:hypothetical protein
MPPKHVAGLPTQVGNDKGRYRQRIASRLDVRPADKPEPKFPRGFLNPSSEMQARRQLAFTVSVRPTV